MNIETVNELIASLESAGELSIREQKFLKLAKEFRICSASLDAAIKTGNMLADQNAQLAAENAGLKSFISQSCYSYDGDGSDVCDSYVNAEESQMFPKTPATEAFLAGVQSKAREEGAYFVANRMLAAWDAGFIDDTARNAADIARMILTSTEFMADAPEGDFDRSFADGVLEDIAAQLRQEAAQ
ncbi:TPA: ead/Ea22-like family protein [Enterobacter hormaechei]